MSSAHHASKFPCNIKWGIHLWPSWPVQRNHTDENMEYSCSHLIVEVIIWVYKENYTLHVSNQYSNTIRDLLFRDNFRANGLTYFVICKDLPTVRFEQNSYSNLNTYRSWEADIDSQRCGFKKIFSPCHQLFVLDLSQFSDGILLLRKSTWKPLVNWWSTFFGAFSEVTRSITWVPLPQQLNVSSP